jgi:hypothetical protein
MLRRRRNSRLLREYKQRSAKIDLAGVDTGAKIFVGLTRGAEVVKVSAEQQGQSENLRGRFAPGVHSRAPAPYYAQPRSQRTESHNLSYLINALDLYSTFVYTPS